MLLANKVVLITGGAGLNGLGFATALQMASHGARSLATKVAQSLRDAKRNPQVLMLVLGPYLGGVSARAVDRTFEVRATLGPEAVEDLVTRLGAMVALARAGSAPGFAPPTAPPPAPPAPPPARPAP